MPAFDPCKLDRIEAALRDWFAARCGHGPGPTVGELAAIVALPPSTVLRNLQRLIDLDRITYTPGRERSWRPT